ncbi:hypothetical protein SY88_09475 [Clostridiales bacterium PH28_bin88]|nr:hypothetical protein SY88_09475 [Clostridiales bacterium PH28_bin88]
MEQKAARASAAVYTGLSLVLVAIFLLLTPGQEYTPVARYGGAVWVFILSMIIFMPIVIPYVKKYQG